MSLVKEIQVQKLLSRKKHTNHLLHLILSACTATLWVPIWILVSISNTLSNRSIDKQIDDIAYN